MPRVRGAAIALALLASTVVAAIAMSFATAHRVVGPGELRERDPGDALIEMSGTVVRGSLKVGAFVLSGDGRRIRVHYAGVAPDGLAPGRRVTVTGRYRHGELSAVADGLRASCDGAEPESHC